MTVIDLKTKSYVTLSKIDTVCVLGNFDGVHIGHHRLFSKAKEEKERLIKEGNTNVKTAVCTFSEHTSLFLGKNDFVKMITELSEKLDVFYELGMDMAILEDFPEIKDMPAEDFAKMLCQKYHAKAAVCGFNYHFGAKGAGNPEKLREYTKDFGVNVICVEPVIYQGKTVSSSLIRTCIENGDVETAAQLLGRPFSINFPVVKGNQFGRTIGIPTINQHFSKYHITPMRGIYACTCNVEGDIFLGVANVGYRPTVNSDVNDINCETHIINYHGWLYGKRIKVSFYKRLRDEKKFSSIEMLKSTVENDIKNTIEYFSDK